ncbi:MAG: hypothetical protein ABSA52_18980 [Candidatus Binatia bacterium]|jgi:hypothetical protein
MEKFIARHAALVSSVLSGLDRLVFRGLLRSLRHRGIRTFLDRAGVRLLDFGSFAQKTTERVKAAALAEAERAQRPVIYIESARASKEDRARELLAHHPLTEPGLICALRTVEPCMRFEYHRSPDPKQRGLKLRPSKCLHIYKYYQHPSFGFMHTRLQTYFPFDVQVCLNGREWVAQQLTLRASEFTRADNCFTWLQDPQLAQELMDEQLRTAWPATLAAFVPTLNPLHEEIFRAWPLTYYWVAYQTEWATDVAFTDAAALASLYPAWVRHARDHFKSPDVLRFLGRTVRQHWKADIVTSVKERPEGVRVKHWLNGNSVKMYDKASNLLRVETTIGNPKDFCVLRPRRQDEGGERHRAEEGAKLVWRNMRKSVADLHRRAALSQRSNQRYLDALALVDDPTPCSRIFDAVSRPVVDNGRRFRAVRLGDPCDLALLEAISRGEFVIAGFRNRDLRQRLYAPPKTDADARRLSGKVSRLLRLLRAHGIIRKISKTHRYQLTEHGRLLTAAVRATRDASIKQLLRDAA